MILDEAVNNLPMAAYLCARLMSLRALDPAGAMNAVLAPLFGDGYQSQWEPATALRPTVFIAGNLARKFVFIDGANNTAQGNAMIDGYGGGTAFASFNGKNQYLHDIADWILNRIATSALDKPEHLDFAGYSLGGAVATLCKMKLVQQQSTYKSKVITFGAPRAGNAQEMATLANSPIARYMNDADPIPLLPPRPSDIPLLLPALGVLTLQRYSTFVHSEGGIVLFANGGTAPGVLPPIASMSAVTSLGAWYFQAAGDANNPHALTRYFANLTMAITLAATPAQQNVDDAPREQQGEANRVKMTREQRRVVGAIHAQGHAQNSVPQVTPEVTLFKAFKQGQIWYVGFGNAIVFTAPIEKRARHIARAGNDFLRSMQKQALVDPFTLLDQMEEFMRLAVDPSSGFSPTVKTNLGL